MSSRRPRRARLLAGAAAVGLALAATALLLPDEDRPATGGGTGDPRLLARDGSPVRAALPARVAALGRRTTLEKGVQAAAVAALGGTGGRASLVALDARSGDVLAVAGRPVAGAHRRALAGLYAPGSTFKVISSHALLAAGVRPGDRVACPASVRVGATVFRNFQGASPGRVPLAEVFARSCNTTYAVLAGKVSPRELRRSALLFGLGRRYRLPFARRARFILPRTDVEHAAAMIGRHETRVSALAMAGVAATVANGRWHEPRLFRSAPVRAGRALASADRSALARMMRAVVTSGTGGGLAGIRGRPAGKTGLVRAQNGRVLSWFIGYRGPLAFAVLVETSRLDQAAVRTAATFLGGLRTR